MCENAVGEKKGSLLRIDDHQRAKLGQNNIHLHLGAEHYSEGEYSPAARRMSGEGGVEAHLAADHSGSAQVHPSGVGAHDIMTSRMSHMAGCVMPQRMI